MGIAPATGQKAKRPSRRIASSPRARPADLLDCLSLALKTFARLYCQQLKRCQKRFSGKAVHDSRVAARRLLSVLELLEPFLRARSQRPPRRFLKHYLDSVSALRDVQMQRQEMKELAGQFPAAAAYADFLKRRKKRLVARTCKAVCRCRAGRLKTLLRQCQRELPCEQQRQSEKSIRRQVHEVLAGRFGRVELCYQQMAPRDPRTIHRVRIAFKHYRYMAEILSPFVPVASAWRRERMHDFQSLMGNIQDNEVLLEAVGKYACKLPLKAARPLLRALQERRKERIDRFLRTGGRCLKSFRPPLPPSSPLQP